jgi:putative glycosyltransferase (TIGR04348 family)
MKIILCTPAGKQSRSGNRATALRWARLLRELGHQVRVTTDDDGRPAAMMIAIHAWRSAAAIAAFRRRCPDARLIVLLAGTDLYRFLQSDPATTLGALAVADALVGLHDLAGAALPPSLAARLTVIRQSARPLSAPRKPSTRTMDVCVIGHLRDVKDPLRAARAAALMPARSRLRVIHLGKAHDAGWAARAHAEMAGNPRYLWRGEAGGAQVRRLYGRAHAMVISSLMEGGANVVSEAIVAGLPVLASDIAGNIGLLGAGYGGYYRCGDSADLAALLTRAETEPGFLDALAAQCRALAPAFTPAAEREAWRSLLDRL